GVARDGDDVERQRFSGAVGVNPRAVLLEAGTLQKRRRFGWVELVVVFRELGLVDPAGECRRQHTGLIAGGLISVLTFLRDAPAVDAVCHRLTNGLVVEWWPRRVEPDVDVVDGREPVVVVGF